MWTFITDDMVIVRGSRTMASHVSAEAGIGEWLLACSKSSPRRVPGLYGMEVCSSHLEYRFPVSIGLF